MNVLSWNALRALTRLGWLTPMPFSLLAPAADAAATDAEVACALTELREAGLLLPDDAGLIPELDQALQIIADPVVRARMVHHRRDGVPKALVAESDLTRAALVGGDTEQVWVSATFEPKQIAAELLDTVCGGELLVAGPAMELVGLEALVLGWALPLVERGELTAATLCTSVATAGVQLNDADAQAALETLVARGWFIHQGERFELAHEGRHLALAPDSSTEIQVTCHGVTEPVTETLRFWRHGQKLWRVEPFLAEHNAVLGADATERAWLVALLGLDLIPQSRVQASAAIAAALGACTEPAGE